MGRLVPSSSGGGVAIGQTIDSSANMGINYTDSETGYEYLLEGYYVTNNGSYPELFARSPYKPVLIEQNEIRTQTVGGGAFPTYADHYKMAAVVPDSSGRYVLMISMERSNTSTTTGRWNSQVYDRETKTFSSEAQLDTWTWGSTSDFNIQHVRWNDTLNKWIAYYSYLRAEGTNKEFGFFTIDTSNVDTQTVINTNAGASNTISKIVWVENYALVVIDGTLNNHYIVDENTATWDLMYQATPGNTLYSGFAKLNGVFYISVQTAAIFRIYFGADPLNIGAGDYITSDNSGVNGIRSDHGVTNVAAGNNSLINSGSLYIMSTPGDPETFSLIEPSIERVWKEPNGTVYYYTSTGKLARSIDGVTWNSVTMPEAPTNTFPVIYNSVIIWFGTSNAYTIAVDLDASSIKQIKVGAISSGSGRAHVYNNLLRVYSSTGTGGELGFYVNEVTGWNTVTTAVYYGTDVDDVYFFEDVYEIEAFEALNTTSGYTYTRIK